MVIDKTMVCLVCKDDGGFDDDDDAGQRVGRNSIPPGSINSGLMPIMTSLSKNITPSS